ncbi:hypothetical protein RhiirA4_458490 [Rhizophagus irregularis]|uniref:Protein kinase domain-containing protein n=1 Tax=Rhizophagus irregularis TaxID=588596 RepID=A0A2I1GCB1_9GLOM|nr:hypothetical protein RhiirA4_458490 [Rhizophagus irregularis]
MSLSCIHSWKIFGVLIWEISSGYPPFKNSIDSMKDIVIAIINGSREDEFKRMGFEINIKSKLIKESVKGNDSTSDDFVDSANLCNAEETEAESEPAPLDTG